jgi:hypothetical protein
MAVVKAKICVSRQWPGTVLSHHAARGVQDVLSMTIPSKKFRTLMTDTTMQIQKK